MIDIRFLRENPEAVKENIRKKFQDAKLPLVDEVVDLDAKRRAAIAEVESLKAARNKLSKANGPLYGQLKKCDDEAKKAENPFGLKTMLLMAIATSIDALAVGITFAFLQVAIVPSVAIIGVVTFVLSFVGVAVGHFFGARFEKPATIVGGVVLILIGLKILLEHLGIIAI